MLQQQNGVSPTGAVAQSTVMNTSSSTRSGLVAANDVDEQGRLAPPTPHASGSTMPRSPMSLRSFNTDFSTNSVTPKPIRSQSALSSRPPSTLGKRSGTAAYAYLDQQSVRLTSRQNVPEPFHGGHRFKGSYKGASVASPRSFDTQNAREFGFAIVDRDEGMDDSFEGLDNVRGE